MIISFFQFLKKILPEKVLRFLITLVNKSYQYIIKFLTPYFSFIRWRYKRISKKIQKKEKITIAFFVIHESGFKVEGLYALLQKDERFIPFIIICPYVLFGQEKMLEEMDKAYMSLKSYGPNVIKTYNTTTKKWLNVNKEIKPDIIFFTNPHPLTKPAYYITNYLRCLTCYSPYGINPSTNLNQISFNQFFHNVLWKYFVETEIHQTMSEDCSAIKGKNVVFAGYPGLDIFFDKNYKPTNNWKINGKKVKRIIWAVHHSLHDAKNYFAFSNFKKLHQEMLDVAKEYDNEIQFVFNPHQLLKPKLYLEPDWGKMKTDAYFEKWNQLDNGQVNESEYVDLFLTSDAIIVDSVSFLTEYLCVNKPSLYIMRVKDQLDTFNEYGKKMADLHYHGSDISDVRFFLNNIVLKEHDSLKEEREHFVRNYLTPPFSSSAAENIYRAIKNHVNYL